MPGTLKRHAIDVSTFGRARWTATYPLGLLIGPFRRIKHASANNTYFVTASLLTFIPTLWAAESIHIAVSDEPLAAMLTYLRFAFTKWFAARLVIAHSVWLARLCFARFSTLT